MNTTLRNTNELPQNAQAFFAMLGAMAEQRDDDDDVVRRTFGDVICAGSLDDDTRSVEFICSTDAIDSYDEVVEQDWKLKRYKKNPVVLYGHNRAGGFFGGLSQNETLPIGYAKETRVQDGKLIARLYFVDAEANPMAEQVWQGLKQKSLRAVSVGFRPGEIDQEKRGGKDVYVLKKNELFEISVVPIGANHEAVARAADGESQNIRERNHAQLDRLIAKQQRDALHASDPTDSPPAPSGTDSNEESEMDQKQFDALQAELDAAKAENDSLKTQADVLGEKLKEETDAHQEATEQVEELTDKVSELTEERDKAAGELGDLKERAEKAEGESIKLEVEKLLNVKITPAELEDAIEDRTRLGAEKFAARMAKRADLPLGKSVAGPDPKQVNSVSSGDSASKQVADKAGKNETEAAR